MISDWVYKHLLGLMFYIERQLVMFLHFNLKCIFQTQYEMMMMIMEETQRATCTSH